MKQILVKTKATSKTTIKLQDFNGKDIPSDCIIIKPIKGAKPEKILLRSKI